MIQKNIPLVTAKNISKAYGAEQLLESVNLTICQNERIALIGRNGSGKSTLFKILNTIEVPDTGELSIKKDIRIAFLSQDIPEKLEGTVFHIVVRGLADLSRLLEEYQTITEQLQTNTDQAILDKLSIIQHQLDEKKAWNIEHKVETVLSKLDLKANVFFNDLSGGYKRKVLLARALVNNPDILFLDEPTNHLDIKSIAWLEDFLIKEVPTCFFVSHDRRFLRKIATRIIELDRGCTYSYETSYDDFILRREKQLTDELTQIEKQDKKWKEEEIWLRKGVKARRTRNEGRKNALMKMRKEREERRSRTGKVSFSINQSDQSSKLVMEITSINFSYPDVSIVNDFSSIIMRGDKIGLIGINGSGKTTLLNILLKKIAPLAGNVKHCQNLKVVYFDQMRSYLDDTKLVKDIIGENNDTVEINGHSRHIVGYLGDFLFSPQRLRSPVSVLSGGEKNRLLLAKLFAMPSNVIVMDEPTNDLDIETLSVLETMLVEYPGTVFIISHDREFINNVVIKTFCFLGNGIVEEYIGADYEKIMKPVFYPEILKAKKNKNEVKTDDNKNSTLSKKLSYKEKTHLEQLPALIEAAEEEQKKLTALLSDPDYYKKNDSEKIQSDAAALKEIEAELEKLYVNWSSLEERL